MTFSASIQHTNGLLFIMYYELLLLPKKILINFMQLLNNKTKRYIK